jgi:hypothetical protein
VLGDPDKAGRRDNADTANSDDTKANHEGKVFHNVLLVLPSNNPKVETPPNILYSRSGHNMGAIPRIKPNYFPPRRLEEFDL